MPRSHVYGLPGVTGVSGRRLADLTLFTVTSAELAFLVQQTPTFGLIDWVYISQHLMVLVLAFARRPPLARDYSFQTGAAVVVAYAYPYALVLYFGWIPGQPVWEDAGFVLVILATALSFASLITLGRSFGVRPALRRLVVRGPYRAVRHPIYLSYLIADIGYSLQEWHVGSLLLVLAGWTALVYRIRAEERVLSSDAGWSAYAASVPYRLLPGLW